MTTSILLGLLSFLLLVGMAFFLQKKHFHNSYLEFFSGYIVLFLFTLLVVFVEELWKPIMGKGYDRLLFLVAITVGSLLNTIVVWIMVYYKRMKKSLLALSITIIFLAPLFAYGSLSAFQWYHLDRHKTTYCIESGGETYTLRLNSEKSIATIGKKTGPHASSPYFVGDYNQQGNTRIIKGKRFISKDSIQKRQYLLTNQKIIDFPEKRDTTALITCIK
ncbi:hypothetical protein [Fodinibius saliphilus]|uniref:hypothetical protein n=1 Tax=Fodinibius saliphilus TaxID=1920650 RepID=UPI0011090F0C|nr:hypothetical protein [Fodinibius saliphilus]